MYCLKITLPMKSVISSTHKMFEWTVKFSTDVTDLIKIVTYLVDTNCC